MVVLGWPQNHNELCHRANRIKLDSQGIIEYNLEICYFTINDKNQNVSMDCAASETV